MICSTTWLLDIKLKPAEKNCRQLDKWRHCAMLKDAMALSIALARKSSTSLGGLQKKGVRGVWGGFAPHI